ncbi:hypothetical protein EIP91_000818 [Steccherinum ochraceum]|uniref:Glycoside hydrolase 35 catalytic domain-containing protein n=1 Tax=Steccherinum ochraceum TaxID=92696 RepID=A0A4R0RVQ9_9APHY|nr:hypothetical protein EIP91_000818 [Steccherinum ochraceum]
MFDAAKAAGTWIVLRPGPYINAETSAGGIPHWVTSRVSGALRSSDQEYREAWTPYIEGVLNATVHNQATHGGPVIAVQIDNEYDSTAQDHRDYFAQIEQVYRDGGITVPFTYNDPGMHQSFINDAGSVNLMMPPRDATTDCEDYLYLVCWVLTHSRGNQLRMRRSHFNATGSGKTINLTINGGTGFSALVYIKEPFMNLTGGTVSGFTNESTDRFFVFLDESLHVGQNKVITVVRVCLHNTLATRASNNVGNDEFTPGKRQTFPHLAFPHS